MSNYEQKIVRYLEEAHATELALVRALQSHVTMTPEGSTRALPRVSRERTGARS
jgi:hypothetical protein